VVPFSLAGRSSTQLVIQFAGASSAPFPLGVQSASPAIFTYNGSGQGQAAALNQDGSFNSASNPASRGSVFSFYLTGAGQMSPPVGDGMISGATLSNPLFPVVVGISNAGSSLLYAGSAPGIVAGVLQVNALMPLDSPIGCVVPPFGGSPPKTGCCGGKAS
jgi:uncharacterized protein (TIGR03437 family)